MRNDGRRVCALGACRTAAGPGLPCRPCHRARRGNLVANQLGWLAGDAVASIAICCLLAGVAAFMSRETMSLLIGEAASAEVVRSPSGWLVT